MESDSESDGDERPKRKPSDDTPEFIKIPEKITTPSEESEVEEVKLEEEKKPASSSDDDDFEIPAMAVYVDDKKDKIEEVKQE